MEGTYATDAYFNTSGKLINVQGYPFKDPALGSSALVVTPFGIFFTSPYKWRYYRDWAASGGVLGADPPGMGAGGGGLPKIAPAPNGSVWMTGSFEDAFAPVIAPDTANALRNRTPSKGGTDCYVVRYEAGPKAAVFLHWGTANDDIIYGVQSDAEGNAFVLARFGAPLVVSPSLTLSEGLSLVKIRPDGTVERAASVSLPPGGDRTLDIKKMLLIPGTEELYALGGWMDLKNGVYGSHTQDPYTEHFLMKCSLSGLQWLKTMPPVPDMAIDGRGNCYVTGHVGASTWRYVGDAVQSSGSYNAFFASYSPSGASRGASLVAPGQLPTIAQAIAVAAGDDAVYVAGDFWCEGLGCTPGEVGITIGKDFVRSIDDRVSTPPWAPPQKYYRAVGHYLTRIKVR